MHINPVQGRWMHRAVYSSVISTWAEQNYLETFLNIQCLGATFRDSNLTGYRCSALKTKFFKQAVSIKNHCFLYPILFLPSFQFFAKSFSFTSYFKVRRYIWESQTDKPANTCPSPTIYIVLKLTFDTQLKVT